MRSITRNPSSTILYQRLHLKSPLSFLKSKPFSTFQQTSNPHPTQTDHHQSPPYFFNHQTPFYTYLFSQLRSPHNIPQAKRLHSLLILNGFFHHTCTDKVLGSQLVNAYAKFGSLHEALTVFTTLPRKSNIAWNAVCRAFNDVGKFSEVMEFFNLMLTQGFIPDNFTYPIVLKACSGLNDLEQGLKVRDLISFNEIRYNISRNVYVECAMIDTFAKCGGLHEARQVFDKMLNRDVASWTSMICGFMDYGECFEAFCLLNKMRMEGIRFDSVILAAVIPACVRVERKQMGLILHCCVVKTGFENDLFVSNALIDMYCKFGDMVKAHVLFSSMVCKDVVSWSTLIAGFSKNGLYGDGFRFYLEMMNVGVRTNPIITVSVLQGLGKLKLLKNGKEMHAYVLKHGFESDVVVTSALIDMYSNFGLTRKAEYVFESTSVQDDIMLWNSLIAAYSSNEDFDSAFRIFRRIEDSCVRPNYITVLSVLPVCTGLGTVRHGKEVHGFVTKTGIEKVVSVGNSLIDMYCKCGYLELGVGVFDRMVEKNVVTYNTIISAHGTYGNAERVFSSFKNMKSAMIKPNKLTFIALLSACSHAGLVEKGWSLFNTMVNDYKITPDMEHYSCMVDLLGRAGRLVEAYRFIERMPVEPGIDVLGSLLGACMVHKNEELANRIELHVLRKKEHDLGFYVLLSNIYASSGRWDDALKLRKMINETGFMKEPGCSWIQVGSSIHKFRARDILHGDFNKIQEVVENLFLEMKNEHAVDSDILW